MIAIIIAVLLKVIAMKFRAVGAAVIGGIGTGLAQAKR